MAGRYDSLVVEMIRKYTPLIFKTTGRMLQARVQNILGSYRCPVCDSRVSGFTPLPPFYLENQQKYGFPFKPEESETCNHLAYSCPLCEASDRDRLYALYLQNHLREVRAKAPAQIVDFAPAPALSAFIRRKIAGPGHSISYRTADYSGVGVDDKVDITDLRIYDDGLLDFFICSHVLEHVDDDRKALRELHRVLKPGGKGILMVPIIMSLGQTDEDPTILDKAERWRRFGQDDHIRIYSKKDFVERLQQAGFLVHEYGERFFGRALFTRSGITDQSVLYVVEKALKFPA